MQDGIKARIEAFIEALFNLHTASSVGTAIPDYYRGFYVEYGVKNARIVVDAHGQRSVYCFIDLSNGDILKAEGWKKPAKGKRGSIWNDGYDVGHDKPCNVHGGGLYKR